MLGGYSVSLRYRVQQRRQETSIRGTTMEILKYTTYNILYKSIDGFRMNLLCTFWGFQNNFDLKNSL